MSDQEFETLIERICACGLSLVFSVGLVLNIFGIIARINGAQF